MWMWTPVQTAGMGEMTQRRQRTVPGGMPAGSRRQPTAGPGQWAWGSGVRAHGMEICLAAVFEVIHPHFRIFIRFFLCVYIE